MSRSIIPRLSAKALQQVQEQLGPSKPGPNKYRAQPVTIDGIRFASKGEAKRYSELLLLQRAGDITDLTPHPRFDLNVNGVKVGVYTADSFYRKNGEVIIEDYKSPATLTEAARLRIKLFEAIYEMKVVFVGV